MNFLLLVLCLIGLEIGFATKVLSQELSPELSADSDLGLEISQVRSSNLKRRKDELVKVDLNSLTPEEVEKFDFTYKDFSPTKGKLKIAGIFRNKKLTGSKLGPLDLARAGAKEATDFTGVDFTGSYNPPSKLFYEKYLSHAILFGLDLKNTRIEKAFNVSHVDFSGSKNIPKKLVKYQSGYAFNWRLKGIDLSKIKIEKLGQYTGFDFTGALNPPENFVVNKFLDESILNGLDLTKIGIQNASRLRNVNFLGSVNPPAKFAKGKSLDGVILGDFDLDHIGLNQAASALRLVIGPGITLNSDTYFPPTVLALSWVFRNPILYRGKYLGKEDFLKIQKILGLIKDFDIQINGKSLILDKLIENFGLENILSFTLDEIQEINFKEILKPEDFLKKMPKKCQEIFNNNLFDESWFPLSQSIHLPANEYELYLQLYKLCHAREKEKIIEHSQKSDMSSLENMREKLKRNVNRSEDDEAFDFQELEVDRHHLEEGLNLYMAATSDFFKKMPVSIKFKKEDGQDGGGVRREFFDLVAPIISKIIKEQVNSKHPQTDFAAIGLMAARSVAVENGIPAMRINAPREFYQHIFSHNDLLQWMVDKIYSDQDDDVAKVKRIVQTLQGSVADFKMMMGIESHDHNHDQVAQPGQKGQVDLREVTETFLDSCGDLQGNNENILRFAQGFQEILPREELIKNGIQSGAQLKDLIEGKEVITKKEFLKNVDIIFEKSSFSNWLMKRAYSKALEGIISDFNRADPSGDQTQKFMRDFLRYATGSSSIGKDKVCILPNSASHLLPTAHTCTNTIDAPTTRDVKAIKKKILKVISLSDEGFGTY